MPQTIVNSVLTPSVGVVSVLFSLISETLLRKHSRLYLFLKLEGRPLGLLMSLLTVSPVLHCLRLTRTTFFIMSFAACGSLEKTFEWGWDCGA